MYTFVCLLYKIWLNVLQWRFFSKMNHLWMLVSLDEYALARAHLEAFYLISYSYRGKKTSSITFKEKKKWFVLFSSKENLIMTCTNGQ